MNIAGFDCKTFYDVENSPYYLFKNGGNYRLSYDLPAGIVTFSFKSFDVLSS